MDEDNLLNDDADNLLNDPVLRNENGDIRLRFADQTAVILIRINFTQEALNFYNRLYSFPILRSLSSWMHLRYRRYTSFSRLFRMRIQGPAYYSIISIVPSLSGAAVALFFGNDDNGPETIVTIITQLVNLMIDSGLVNLITDSGLVNLIRNLSSVCTVTNAINLISLVELTALETAGTPSIHRFTSTAKLILFVLSVYIMIVLVMFGLVVLYEEDQQRNDRIGIRSIRNRTSMILTFISPTLLLINTMLIHRLGETNNEEETHINISLIIISTLIYRYFRESWLEFLQTSISTFFNTYLTYDMINHRDDRINVNLFIWIPILFLFNTSFSLARTLVEPYAGEYDEANGRELDEL